MSLLDRALDAIRARRPAARALGIELVGVVGSVARGEASVRSDVDVAYEVVGPASLLDLAGLHLDLSDELGRRVDMVDLRRVRPRMVRDLARDLVRA